MRSLVVFLSIVGVAVAQYEAGHVKILQDKRYQEGAAFGNYRDQEDGIKYQEETDLNGVRKGFWEYPDETGKILRIEFEAGAGIGFRITNSNYVGSTPISNTIPDQPALRAPSPAPVRQHQAPQARHPQPEYRPQPVHRPQPAYRPQPVQQPQQFHQPQQVHHQQPAPLPVVRTYAPTTTTPRGINLFDYPANLDFSRHSQGHSFKFSAV